MNTNDEEEEFNVNILGGDSGLFAPEMDSETSSPVKQPGTLTSIRESPEPVAAVPSTESDAAQPDFIVSLMDVGKLLHLVHMIIGYSFLEDKCL